MDDRERRGEILVYRRAERDPHRILSSIDGVNWKPVRGEFDTLDEALETIKRLHRWYGKGSTQWCAKNVRTGTMTGLLFEVDDDNT